MHSVSQQRREIIFVYKFNCHRHRHRVLEQTLRREQEKERLSHCRIPSLSENIAMEISVLRYYCFSCAIICNILLANFALGQSDAIYDTCGARPGTVDFAHFCAFRTKFKKPKRLFLIFLADNCVGFPDGCIEDRARTFFFQNKMVSHASY